MRRSVLLKAQDRKHLLVCCLVGIALGVVVVVAGLVLRHLLGHGAPDWDLVVGLSFSLGILLGLLLFLWRQLTLRGRLALATEQRQRGTWTYNPETHELVLSAEVER